MTNTTSTTHCQYGPTYGMPCDPAFRYDPPHPTPITTPSAVALVPSSPHTTSSQRAAHDIQAVWWALFPGVLLLSIAVFITKNRNRRDRQRAEDNANAERRHQELLRARDGTPGETWPGGAT
jgi:hypothetical protein